jgi:hypothetical protein
LVEPRVIEEEQKLGTYSLFFIEVCSGDECYAEWNEAIRRVLHIPITEDTPEIELIFVLLLM